MSESKPKRICPDCDENISARAVKCRYCGRFLNWRRYTGLSSMFLSLILALISMSTVFLTVATDALSVKNSAIEIALVNQQRAYFNDYGGFKQILRLELFVTNSGTRPGILKTITVRGKDQEDWLYLREGEVQRDNEFSHEALSSREIEPGDSVLVSGYIKTTFTVEEFNDIFAGADLRAEIVNFRGSETVLLSSLKNSAPEFYRE